MNFEDIPVDNERVEKLTQLYRTMEKARHEFAIKHGFAYKRPQNFKNCIVIRWKTTRERYGINYPRIEEYTKISHEIADKYNLWDAEFPLLDADYRLFKAGIYSFTEFHRTWAIPNEYKELQDYIIPKLPKWAKLTRKA